MTWEEVVYTIREVQMGTRLITVFVPIDLPDQVVFDNILEHYVSTRVRERWPGHHFTRHGVERGDTWVAHCYSDRAVFAMDLPMINGDRMVVHMDHSAYQILMKQLNLKVNT